MTSFDKARRWARPRVSIAIAVVAVAAASTAAISASASTAPPKSLSACAKKQGGALRLAAHCNRDERAVSWTQGAGPVGPGGPGRPGRAAGNRRRCGNRRPPRARRLTGWRRCSGARRPRGTAGPKGGDGAAGPVGPAGAAGPAGVSGYLVATATSDPVPPGRLSPGARATCPSGTKPIGGGGKGSDSDATLVLVDSYPDGSDWVAAMGNISQNPGTFTVFAVCATA